MVTCFIILSFLLACLFACWHASLCSPCFQFKRDQQDSSLGISCQAVPQLRGLVGKGPVTFHDLSRTFIHEPFTEHCQRISSLHRAGRSQTILNNNYCQPVKGNREGLVCCGCFSFCGFKARQHQLQPLEESKVHYNIQFYRR